MANHSFGKITVPTAGTPVRLTINETNPAAQLLVHAVLIQPHPANVGRIYIGNVPNFIKNGAGQVAWLAAPTTTSSPAFSETVSYAVNSVEANELYIDVDNSGESVIASGIVA
jgi:hypothetical protein